MTVDPAGLLDPLAAPSLPAEFSAAIRGVMKGPDVGPCGTDAYMRQPVFVTDIANDPKWAKFKELALAADLRACWSAPIPGPDGEAVGAMALYYREPSIAIAHGRTRIGTIGDTWGRDHLANAHT